MEFANAKKAWVYIFVIAAVFFFIAIPANALGIPKDNNSDNSLLEERLNNDEIRTVEDAIDDSLHNTDIYKSYNITAEDILRGALGGSLIKDLGGVPKLFASVFGNELKTNLALILKLFAIMLLGAVIRALQPLQSGIPNEAAKLGINGVIILIASVSFGSMVSYAANAIESMQNVASIAMPALIALMASSGQIVTVSAIQPLLLIAVNIACQIFKTILLPLSVSAGLLFLIDGVSDRFNLKTLAKLFKSCTIWVTGVVTLFFSIAVSIQKIASTSVDAVTLKTTKFAISTFVPVAGKYMADAADTIILCASAVRNAVGILTVTGLILICLIPFIKVFIIMLALRLAAAFGAPICDESICDALEEASGCLSAMLGVMGASLFVLILLTGALMNSGGLLR